MMRAECKLGRQVSAVMLGLSVSFRVPVMRERSRGRVDAIVHGKGAIVRPCKLLEKATLSIERHCLG